MQEVFPSLHIGNEDDYEFKVKLLPGWKVVHACKEPYHRDALGYSGRGAPKSDPEYLIARRGNRLILNLIDAPQPEFIPQEIIDAALEFIRAGLQGGHKVLVHCNQGESRSPSIGLLYLAVYTDALPTGSLTEAETAFRKLYPAYNPGSGMRGFLQMNWGRYITR